MSKVSAPSKRPSSPTAPSTGSEAKRSKGASNTTRRTRGAPAVVDDAVLPTGGDDAAIGDPLSLAPSPDIVMDSSAKSTIQGVPTDGESTADSSPLPNESGKASAPPTSPAAQQGPSQPSELHSSPATSATSIDTLRERLSKLIALERYPEVGFRYKGVRPLDNIPSVAAWEDFPNEPDVIERLFKICAFARGHNLAPIFNIDKSLYTTTIGTSGSYSRRVLFKGKTDKLSTAFMPDGGFGTVVRVATSNTAPNEYSRVLEITGQVLHRMGPRSVSNIAHLLEFDAPVTTIGEEGLSFATSTESLDDPRFQWMFKKAEMNGRKHGPSPRPNDESIPIYNGLKTFDLYNYHLMSPLEDGLYPGDYAFIAFSLQGYLDTAKTKAAKGKGKGKDDAQNAGSSGSLPSSPKKSPSSPKKWGSPKGKNATNDPPPKDAIQKAKFNILFAVLLARPGTCDDDDDKVCGAVCDYLKDETPIGVKATHPMLPLLPNEPQPGEMGDGDDDSEAHDISEVF
ncbi:hypothetical protein CYLTODRAFT_458270 [Cylindrobasidium torrendii FP15055 ss-10]|uniref:Uncharacterized protein n=1 Tax=Cylindrobasidium torrendii FP15055 ss-10 TaxID=1314674 RepID=A0A0D7AZF2_9AGAR|nr:hypothetical protein CYLTODRAFT_458270 [Cylindrobasidium torrendii FP15055 ss-10]